MRRNSHVQDLIPLMLAAGPLRAISDDAMLWRAWIDVVSSNWNMFCQHGFRWPPKFILACAFLCARSHFLFLSRGDSHQGWTDGR